MKNRIFVNITFSLHHAQPSAPVSASRYRWKSDSNGVDTLKIEERTYKIIKN